MSGLPARSGLTLVEIIVSMLILAVLGTVLVSVLPGLTRNTRVATTDTTVGQTVYSVFEVVGASWSNPPAFDAEYVDDEGTRFDLVSGASGSGYVALRTGGQCEATVTALSDVSGGAVRKRVVIACAGEDGGAGWSMRAEYGDPGE